MKKTPQQKIEGLEQELKEIALEIIDDIDLTDEFEDSYSCFIRKDLYDEYNKVIDKINKMKKET